MAGAGGRAHAAGRLLPQHLRRQGPPRLRFNDQPASDRTGISTLNSHKDKIRNAFLLICRLASHLPVRLLACFAHCRLVVVGLSLPSVDAASLVHCLGRTSSRAGRGCLAAAPPGQHRQAPRRTGGALTGWRLRSRSSRRVCCSSAHPRSGVPQTCGSLDMSFTGGRADFLADS